MRNPTFEEIKKIYPQANKDLKSIHKTSITVMIISLVFGIPMFIGHLINLIHGENVKSSTFVFIFSTLIVAAGISAFFNDVLFAIKEKRIFKKGNYQIIDCVAVSVKEDPQGINGYIIDFVDEETGEVIKPFYNVSGDKGIIAGDKVYIVQLPNKHQQIFKK